MVIVCRGFATAISMEDAAVGGVFFSRCERLDLCGGWQWCKFDCWEIGFDTGDCGWKCPQVHRKEMADKGNNLPLGGAGVVAEGKSGAEEEESKKVVTVHTDNIWIPFDMPKCS